MVVVISLEVVVPLLSLCPSREDLVEVHPYSQEEVEVEAIATRPTHRSASHRHHPISTAMTSPSSISQ